MKQQIPLKNNQDNYYIYARKSTEAEDRQVLSIPAQIDELQDLATNKQVHVLDPARTEAMSAKAPGRPIFGQLMQDIQDGKVQGVICWKLDRLARNPVDGGALIWALDQGKLKEIITPSRSFTNNGDDKFWMQLEFGMAKKYVDDLSVSVKRGIKKKLESGGLSGRAPIGYLNDRLNKTVVQDGERFHLIRRMWNLLLSGAYSVKRIHEIASEEWGLRSPVRMRTGGKRLALSHIYDMFRNPFYCGIIRRLGELYPGKHTAMVTVEEFEQAQRIVKRASHPKPQIHNFPFTGLIRCGECGRMITADTHKKKSGLVFTYYHCTKRRTECSQKYVRAGELEAQIKTFLDRLRVDERYGAWLESQLEEGSEEANAERTKAVNALERRIVSVRRQMQVLADLRTKEEIDPEDYRTRYNALVAERTLLEQKLTQLGNDGHGWFEPARRAVSLLKQAKNCLGSGTSDEKRAILYAVGSNPQLKDGKLLISAKKPFQLLLERSQVPVWSG